MELKELYSTKFIVLYLFLFSAVYIHLRGKVKHSFFRQLTDHSTLMAPINLIMYFFSKVPAKPYLPLSKFPQLQGFKDNWEVIKEEALHLHEQSLIQDSKKYNDIGFNSFFRRGWKRFYLKWYKDFHPSAREHCPKTIELIQNTKGIKAAMFTFLPAGSELLEHRDPYAGSLRYHLGLVTPNDDGCYIIVDGERYSWRDGEEVLFDETYIHNAKNETSQDRLIFFCDVERPMIFPFNYVNKFFAWFLIASAASPNDMGTDKTGFLNRIFGYLYQIRLVGKRIKAWNRRFYYIMKYVGLALILYLIFS